MCTLEHRDGSGPRTFVNQAPEVDGSIKNVNKHDHIDRSAGQKERNYDRIDYVWPKYNPHDTMPQNDNGFDLELRSATIGIASCRNRISLQSPTMYL